MSGNDADARDANDAGEATDAGNGSGTDADGVTPPDGASAADDGVAAADATTATDGADGPPDGEHDSLLAALHVGRHARVGLAVGIGLAAVLYVPRYPVLDASIEGARGYYLGLAFVLAATTAAVVTAALSIKTFLEPVLDRAAWLRRGGVLAVLGGLGWIVAPICAAMADAGTIDVRLWRNVTSLASLALLVGTIGLHAAVRPATAELGERLRRVERAAYWVVLVGLLIAAANATGNAGPTATVADGTAATPFLIGVLLASFASIPFAAVAELTGRLPRWWIRSLQIGALSSTIGIAWLVPLDGWGWLVEIDAPEVAVGLAIVLVPAGLGWAIAGWGCWVAARAESDRS